ncbi:MAG: hypothetical protein MMC33_002716 [Icmadophila ericetorum]|nr:hypothetical protein [Icmadophila ericetorum]
MSFYDDPRNFFDALGPGFPKPSSYPSPAKVRREAKTLSQEIFATWDTLHAILERHEEVIRRRWGKKSQEQRKKVLLTAWPNMAPHHRPDYSVMDKESPEQRANGTKYRDAYVWPYINLEDLVQPKSLLFFLNSRCRHLPDVFAHVDYDATHLGIVNIAIKRPFLNRYTMFFQGRTTPKTYGEVVSWDDDHDACDLMVNNFGKCPGDGLLILEIQSKVLRFLVQCCRLILADIPPSSLLGNDTPIQHDPGPVMTDPTAWRSLGAMAEEAPYKVPGCLDFRRAQAIIAAKSSAAKDHIWALREDPGYFANIVVTASIHRQELLLDIHGKKHPNLNTPLFWNFVLGSIVASAYDYQFIWEDLHKQITRLIALEEKYSMEISLKQDLPPEYRNALLSFRFHLVQAVNSPRDDLKMIVPASPPLCSLFERLPQKPNTHIISIRTKKRQSRLLYLLETLWDDYKLFLHRFPNLMDELDRYIRNDLSQKHLISPLVAEKLSDLSVLSECIRQIDLYQPWAAHSDFEEVGANPELTKLHMMTFIPFKKLYEATHGIDYAHLGTPASENFYYPVDKRRTKENVEAIRKAEQNLDLFWDFVDTEVSQKDKIVQSFMAAYQKVEGRQFLRTPEWIEPLKKVTEVKDATLIEAPWKSLAQLDVNSRKSTMELIHEEKIKVKTRGVARPPPSIAATGTALPSSQADFQPNFSVSKRTLKVFSALFHKPSSEADIPGDIPWPEFLHAIVSVGFGAEKLYGSAWQFMPNEVGCGAEYSVP